MSKKKTQELASKATNLAGLINYQEGSVVSRSIIDRKTGSITLFAFDQNQGLSEHTAPYDAVVYILEGEINVTISGKQVVLMEGEMTILPSNAPHALAAKTPVKMLLVMIKS